MKYKVGDKVRVRSGLQINRSYGAYTFISEMSDYKGSVVAISEVYLTCYCIEEDKGIWKWTDEMFEGLAEDELTAEEATKILGEICCGNELCGGCPIQKAKGKMSCQNFRRDKPEEVLEILKQWKKEHEKKEVETEFTWCVLIIEADTHTLKHEEKVGTDFKSMDAKKAEILKKYCSEHDGKYYAISEHRCVVKE